MNINHSINLSRIVSLSPNCATERGGGAKINIKALLEAVEIAAKAVNDFQPSEGKRTHEADALIRDKGHDIAMSTCELRRQLGFTQDLSNLSKFVEKKKTKVN